MDSSHLAGHTGSALRPPNPCTTPQKCPFLPQKPHSETSTVRPFLSAPLIHIHPSPIRVQGPSIRLTSLPPLWGRGEVQGPTPTLSSGTWGSLWGVPGQAPNTHLHPGAPAAPFCSDFTSKQALFCPPPSAQGCRVRVSPGFGGHSQILP